MLFHPGMRPEPAAVRLLAERDRGFAVTLDPSSDLSHVEDGRGSNWLELLVNGLTFDLRGLVGGPPASISRPKHLFGMDEAPSDDLQAITLAAGPHLAGGDAMLPIVRSQLALALQLATLPGLVGIVWAPARSWMAVNYFSATVSAWLQGGAFPALGLTALITAPDGGLHSEGLRFFTGQELRIEPELAGDRLQASKLAVRLINALVEHGALGEGMEAVAPDGSPITLEPSANNAFVRVRSRR